MSEGGEKLYMAEDGRWSRIKLPTTSLKYLTKWNDPLSSSLVS